MGRCRDLPPSGLTSGVRRGWRLRYARYLMRAVALTCIVFLLGGFIATATARPMSADMTPHGKLLEVRVDGNTRPADKDLELTVGDKVIHATSVRSGADEPTAIMFLVSEKMPDYSFVAIDAVFDRLGFASRFPPQTVAGVVSYGDTATARVPLTPLQQLHGAQLICPYVSGYHSDEGLAAGITVALDQLERSTAPRKLLLVISMWGDSNFEPAHLARLRTLRDRANNLGVEIFAINYAAEYSTLGEIDPRATSVNSAEGIEVALKDILRYVNDRYYVTFDLSKLPVWNGKESKVTFKSHGAATEPILLRFPAYPASPWWRAVWLLVVVGVALTVVVVILRVRAARLL